MRPLAVLVLLGLAASARADDFPIPLYDAPRMIFFEPESAEAGDKATYVVQLAVQIATHYHAKREMVTGYCDVDEIAARSCPALARRRAEAAKAALIQQGMKAGMIEIETSEELFDPLHKDFNRRVVMEPL